MHLNSDKKIRAGENLVAVVLCMVFSMIALYMTVFRFCFYSTCFSAYDIVLHLK